LFLDLTFYLGLYLTCFCGVGVNLRTYSRLNELVVLGGLMEVGELGTGDFGGFIRSITL